MADVQTITLAEYLFTRLKQLGVQSIHGVPGDFNLQLLDYVEREPCNLRWVGNANELNAAYAADGYSRVKGLGALVTTFGVGELSAVNGIAGAYAELAPVVHIVGTPSREARDNRARVHHTFNDGEFDRFALMHAHITVAQACLWDPRTAPELIDRTIQQCLIHSRPVYIQFPIDMVTARVPKARLQTKIEIPLSASSSLRSSTVAQVLARLYKAERPMILIDQDARSLGIADAVQKIVQTTNWPTWTSASAKGFVDETLPNTHGIWTGKYASEEDTAYIQASDLVLCFGPHWSSTNSYAFSAVPNKSVAISFTHSSVVLDEKVIRDLPSQEVLADLIAKLDVSKLAKSTKTKSGVSAPPTPSGPLKHDTFWAVFNQYLRPGDVLLGETGTAAYGMRNLHLREDTQCFLPCTWLSIGYMVGAAQGAGLARRELFEEGKTRTKQPPRTILFIGDGSFQMTAQELSTIIRLNLNMLVVLVNNDGYTIEKMIHGLKERYNDVARWRYLETPSAFGADPEYAPTGAVKRYEDLAEAMRPQTENSKPMLHMVEVFFESEDAQPPLLDLLKLQMKNAEEQARGEK